MLQYIELSSIKTHAHTQKKKKKTLNIKHKELSMMIGICIIIHHRDHMNRKGQPQPKHFPEKY
jgi:hypothetical protein